MNKIKKICLVFGLIILLSGCTYPSNKTEPVVSKISVGNKAFTIEEIENGIVNTFNNVLYYNGNDDASSYLTMNKNLLLGKSIKYKLYFNDKNEGTNYSQIWFIITNVKHPLSTNETQQLYVFAINITELGLQSDFSFMGRIPANQGIDFIIPNTVDLGEHSFMIDEIRIPSHEIMSDSWKQNTQNSIRLYMDKNDFYADKDENLSPGKYNVYIQGFSKSDEIANIIFENKNGEIYIGYYYFVHEIIDNTPADLNHVELCEDSEEAYFKIYLERVRLNSALSMEYEVNS